MGETVRVREAGAADVAAAAEVWHAAHLARRNGRALPKEQHDLVYTRMTAPGALLLVAEDFTPPDGTPPDGTPPDATAPETGPPLTVGTLLAVPGRADDGAGPLVPELLHISLVSVLPDRWGERVGRLLMGEILGRAPALGHRYVQLWTYADNMRANRLYRAHGFRRTGRAHIDDWGELIVQYRRDVSAPPPG
ncbi:GNAT family N-acetyltransferase [Streptomyces sp. NPDC092296]|uniref:GNAT family N-acetyltransferase n=1 Tax=Streptomyces sp. NPDC092296 TaxID=3366012 RepID=UPI0037F86A12